MNQATTKIWGEPHQKCPKLNGKSKLNGLKNLRRCIMKIEICGTGCPKCIASERNAKKAVEELEKEAKLKEDEKVMITQVKDVGQISARGVFFTPAVIVDGVKVAEGRIPEVKEIKKWIEERLCR